jgi:hypothetical protein
MLCGARVEPFEVGGDVRCLGQDVVLPGAEADPSDDHIGDREPVAERRACSSPRPICSSITIHSYGVPASSNAQRTRRGRPAPSR